MPIQSETELYAPVKGFFERLGYTVKAEVLNCDLVAMKPDEEPVLVELKKSFNLPLVIQGMERQRRSGRVYLAVEQNRNGKAPYGLRWCELIRLCRKLELGLLVVRFYKTKAPAVEVLCDPEPAAPRPTGGKKRPSVKTVRLVREFQERSGDYNVGGSSKVKLVTAYREKALLCAQSLSDLGGEGLSREVRARTGYANAATLMRTNHYRWFQHTDKGRYALTPLGAEALLQYRHVLEGRTALEPPKPASVSGEEREKSARAKKTASPKANDASEGASDAMDAASPTTSGTKRTANRKANSTKEAARPATGSGTRTGTKNAPRTLKKDKSPKSRDADTIKLGVNE
ncbi:DUF2161 family putative PD-(D/E)XK-type phosphodiesterase [Gorillibacterium sp. sgz500922]|uniref:DUF2161 family putative PD-(D/E)XK-type phosphodiesterase n=1 Tax=Gorillibacterium sp. sgz500922 TaxID=3446694 RepID=UPI003F676BD4